MTTETDRPLCRCHGEPMGRNGTKWQCVIKKRARERASSKTPEYRERKKKWQRTYRQTQKYRESALPYFRARHHANPEAENYARRRRELRARIATKAERIAHAEAELLAMCDELGIEPPSLDT